MQREFIQVVAETERVLHSFGYDPYNKILEVQNIKEPVLTHFRNVEMEDVNEFMSKNGNVVLVNTASYDKFKEDHKELEGGILSFNFPEKLQEIIEPHPERILVKIFMPINQLSPDKPITMKFNTDAEVTVDMIDANWTYGPILAQVIKAGPCGHSGDGGDYSGEGRIKGTYNFRDWVILTDEPRDFVVVGRNTLHSIHESNIAAKLNVNGNHIIY